MFINEIAIQPMRTCLKLSILLHIEKFILKLNYTLVKNIFEVCRAMFTKAVRIESAGWPLHLFQNGVIARSALSRFTKPCGASICFSPGGFLTLRPLRSKTPVPGLRLWSTSLSRLHLRQTNLSVMSTVFIGCFNSVYCKTHIPNF